MNIFSDPLFLPKKVPFGLELSDLSVKIVQLGLLHGHCMVSVFGSVPLPSGSIVDGEIKDAKAVCSAIAQCVQKTKVRTRKVFCSLPEGKSFLRVIEMPVLREEELEESIKWQIEENIPMEADQLYYDWTPIQKNFSKDPKKMSILLVAVSRGIVDSFLEVLEASGLTVVGMGTESIAQAQSLLSEEATSRETVLMVDIGDRRTTLTFAVGGTPCFTSGISLSSQMMTDAIAKSLRITREEAERLKQEQGIGSCVKRDPLFCAVEAILENLGGQMQISMDFFTGGLKFSQSVDKVILCGGGANMEGLPVYLGRRLGKSVERGNPWIRMNLGKSLPTIPYQESLRYSTAIGLAWQGLEYIREE